ncbi:MAG: methyltransferase domain-containing protein [Betaproteobacteria bacterium]|nr:methyltransferase domain-containing protein [Betaproteobacteria bacterium]
MESATDEHLQPHAVLDLPSRFGKALKIERLLGLSTRHQPLRLLEIGTGSGGIAHYFATHHSLNCDVTAVDVIDQRQIREGYRFVQVADTRLPFDEASFDVVLSNHVIEHVGEENDQRRHLSELRRVLKPGGIGYLAVPNRWMLIEPHYRLAFLSWLPKCWRTPYLRLMRRGTRYDCSPLTLSSVERLLRESGLQFEYMGTHALREILAIEGGKGALATLVATLPDWFLDRLAVINPTLVYRLERVA